MDTNMLQLLSGMFSGIPNFKRKNVADLACRVWGLINAKYAPHISSTISTSSAGEKPQHFSINPHHLHYFQLLLVPAQGSLFCTLSSENHVTLQLNSLRSYTGEPLGSDSLPQQKKYRNIHIKGKKVNDKTIS